MRTASEGKAFREKYRSLARMIFPEILQDPALPAEDGGTLPLPANWNDSIVPVPFGDNVSADVGSTDAGYGHSHASG